MNLAVALTVILAASPAAAQDERPTPTLADLQFEGVEAIDEDLLRGALWIKLPSSLPWADAPPLDIAELERDLERIAGIYREHGYPRARVTYTRRTDERSGRTRVTILVDEGAPVRIDRVELAGFEPLSLAEQSRLVERIGLQPGDPQARAAVVRGAQLGIRALAEKGYAHARVNVDEREVAPDRVRIRYEASPGPLAVFGGLTVAGNRRLGEDTVRRSVTFAPGDPYSARALDATREELLELGIVESAVVSALDPPNLTDPPRRADVVVHVTERRPQQTGFWFGYGTEEEFRGEIEWRHLNVAGGARTLALNARWTSIDRGVGVSFLQPHLFTRRLALSVRAQWWHTSQLVFETTTRGGTVRLTGDAGRRGRWGVDWTTLAGRAEVTDDAADSVRADILAALGLASASQTGDLTTMGLDAAYESVPAGVLDEGAEHAASIRLEQAGRWLPGSFRFVELSADARYARPLAAGVSLVLRGRAGSIDPIGAMSNIPLFKRYFLGGSQSLRGWGRDEIGPLSPAGLPTGGTSLLLGSAEVSFPLKRPFRAVLFFDAGNVWNEPWRLRPGDLLYDAGTGLRYPSPFGLVGVDAGYQLTPRAAPRLTGNGTDRRWRIHFTLGQSF